MTEPSLRVLLLLGRSAGGIGTHVADLRHQLSGLGARVEVATDDSTAAAFGWAEARRLWPGAAGVAASAHRLSALRHWCASTDIVHAHGHQAGVLAAALRATLAPAGRRRGQPALVISLHNELPPLTTAAARAIARASAAAVRSADLVTGASSDLVAWARDSGARRAQLAEVPSPRVPELLAAGTKQREEARRGIRAELGLAPGAPLAATISRVAPQKDLGTLIAASALLPEVAWVVAGAGDAPLLARAREQAHEQGAPVRFLGAVANPARLLLAADMFVLTSRWEARALVVQEAMAAGTPVVASAVGGIPDLLGDVGTLVPPGDPHAVVVAVAGLLADPRAAAGQAHRGRALAARWPDGRQAARRWLAAYAELLA
ncbi:MAG: glycosyltransferase family 4 protein [Tetrasphaera sp.]